MERGRIVEHGVGIRLGACLATAMLLGTSIPPPSVAYFADVAADIAVIEIRSEVPVLFEYGRSKFACGCAYRANVIESFRGERGEIEFASVRCSMFRGFARKYLVFTDRHDDEYLQKRRTEKLLSWETEFDRARQVCVLSGSKKLVQAGRPGMVPFHTQLDGAGEEWLVVDRDSVGSFGSFHRRQEVVDGRALELVSWADVKAEIERVVNEMSGSN